jgi:ArsR family transcriptional regulator
LDELLAPELFKAIGDPVRVRLLACVAKCGRACSVGEVAQCCDLDLSTVSRHLTTLARAGVMESSKRGTSVLYAVRYDFIATTLHALAAAFEVCRPSDTGDSEEGGCNDCC